MALLALSACSSDNAPLGDGGVAPCASDDACMEGQYCASGACAACPASTCSADPDCPLGSTCEADPAAPSACAVQLCVVATCADDADCPEGALCLEGACGPAPACDDEVPCPEDLVCVEGACARPEDLTCADDEDCPEGTICVLDQCQAPVPCADSAECPGDLVCIQEVCRAPCTQDSDCGSGLMWSCDTGSGECIQRCLNDNMCPAGQFCQGGLCRDAECERDEDCGAADRICEGADAGRGRCVDVILCGAAGECPVGYVCDGATGRCEALPGCRTDRDCDEDAYCEDGFCVPTQACTAQSCPSGFECVGAVCVPAVCRSDADCPTPGEVCVGGACQAAPSTEFVTQVRIITPAGFVRPGTTYAFTALALDQAGRVVPGVTFEWTSSSTVVATIDARGVATGGPTAGVTQIRARVQSGIGPVESSPVRLTNLGPEVMQQIRVTVVRQDSGLPVAGAQVDLHSPGTQSAVTDASGVATFTQTGPAQAYSVTAAHPDHDWVTVLGASTPDLRLELPPLSRTDRAAGAKGTVDLGQVTTQGALSLSLSGASLASPLFGSEPAQVFGGDIFNVQVPMLGNVPLPAGNTVRVEFMGFPLTLKDTYYARAQPGLRALWSFGGKIDLGNSGLGLGDLQNLLAALLPFYQRFEHTVDPVVPMLAVPTVVDTNDVNGNGDASEQVPDWSSFPSRTLTPRQAQNLRFSLTVDNLPFVSGGNANTLVVMSGVILPGVGFVPLGLDGQSDGQGTGIVQTFVTKMAPRHGGLEAGTYGVMVSAIRLDMGGLPGPGSVRLYTSDHLPTAVDLSDGWLDSPVDATWAATPRQATLPANPGTDLYHLTFAGPDGTWHVYAPAAAGATTVDLPPAPTGLTDRAAGAAITVDAVDLATGVDPATLFDAAAPGAVGLDRVTRGFSRAVVE